MGHEVVRGQLVKREAGFERIPVTYICNPKGVVDVLTFVNGVLMLKRWTGEDGLVHFAGPTFAGWENLRATQPDLAGYDMVGAICATPDGKEKGRIDWIRPVDGGKIAEHRKGLVDALGKSLPEVLTHQTVKLPYDLKTFAGQLVLDPILNADMAAASGEDKTAADMIECILKAAVRLALGEG